MKSCPSCRRIYVDSEQVCPLDDGRLVASNAPAPAGVGRAMGPYLLVSQLGEGGMGTIYIGRHTGLGRYVAIKVLRPELASRKDNVARFFQEAHTINRLKHPNIVESIDLVEDAIDGAYCVLELLRGPDLKTRLARGALSLESAVHIGVQLADALGAVHALGVVHRDLKPENLILIARDGRDDTVKLIDFGVAQIGGEGTQAVIGTAAYMAPEQAVTGASVDRRADVYSLGVLLFEMVTGRHPFPSATDSEYILRHAEDKPPRPSKLASKCPPALDDIILRCLAKKPEQRYADAAQVASALRLVNARAGRSKAGVIIAAAFVIGGGAAAAYLIVPRYLQKNSEAKAETVAEAPVVENAPVEKPVEKPAEQVAEQAPVEAQPAAPTIVEISIHSKPAGATVFRAGETVALGVTPFTVQLPRSDTPTHMRFELGGHNAKIIEVPIAEDMEINVNLAKEATSEAVHAVRLKKSTKSSKSSTGEGSPPPVVPSDKKVQREGVIDPFAK
ncbi:MAG TPA: serine/threonine-protein kinase [Kofleriaceae bacterium]|nr:serine/threonine-protein kinase [Kofleriaceae bacterium]